MKKILGLCERRQCQCLPAAACCSYCLLPCLTVTCDSTLPRCVYPVLLDDAVSHFAGRRLPGDADAGAVA